MPTNATRQDAARTGEHDGVVGKVGGWTNTLPAWIRESKAFVEYRAGERHTLQVIADRCDKAEPGWTGALLGCFGGQRLANGIGCTLRTLRRHIRKLKDDGFIIEISRGVGHLASIYAVPGEQGELEAFEANGEVRGRGHGGRWMKSDTWRIRRELANGAEQQADEPSEACHTDTADVPAQHVRRDKMPPQTCHNVTLPSPIPSPLPSSSHQPNNDDVGFDVGEAKPARDAITAELIAGGVTGKNLATAADRLRRVTPTPSTAVSFVRKLRASDDFGRARNKGGWLFTYLQGCDIASELAKVERRERERAARIAALPPDGGEAERRRRNSQLINAANEAKQRLAAMSDEERAAYLTKALREIINPTLREKAKRNPHQHTDLLNGKIVAVLIDESKRAAQVAA